MSGCVHAKLEEFCGACAVANLTVALEAANNAEAAAWRWAGRWATETLDAQRKRDEAMAAEAAVRRQLAEVEARYRDALTVLSSLPVRSSRYGEQGLHVRGSEVLHLVSARTMQAWERIRARVEAQA